MGTEKENNEINKEADELTNKENSKDFIRQTIKGKKPSCKAVFIRLLIVAAFAAVAAFVAAIVFVNTKSIAENMSGKAESNPRITIAPDEQNTDTLSDSSTESEKSDSTDTSSASGENTDTQVTTSPVPTAPVQNEPVKEDTSVNDYIHLQDQLMDIANESMKCMVSVTAISSQMDYFNQSVEDKKTASGVIIAQNDSSYFILTEERIIENVERIQITFNDGAIVDAIFQMSDPDTGLAVLKVNSEDIPEETISGITTAPLGNSYSVEIGDTVIALGSPNGYSNSVEFGRITSDSEIISAIDCEYNLLVTDIIGSDSGSGILVNLKGFVVGVIDQSFCDNGSQIVMALSISQLKGLIEKLTNAERRSYIGIKGKEVTESVSNITGIPKGVIVTSVEEDSPALYAGLTQYDVITALGDVKITDMSQYKTALYDITPGEQVVVYALRKGAEGYKEINFTVETGEI